MILTAAAAMVLVGCVGSGSSSAMDIDTPPPSPIINGITLSVGVVNTKFDAAAKATAESGSTTQSSEMADRVGIADANPVLLRDGQISFNIENSGSGASWDEISTENNADVSENVEGLNVVRVAQEISGGTLSINIFTDIDSRVTTYTPNDVDTTPIRLTVGDTYSFVRQIGQLDGVDGAFLCTDGATCGIGHEDDGTIVSVANYLFIPHQIPTEEITVGIPSPIEAPVAVIVEIGQSYTYYYDEIEHFGVLGTLEVIAAITLPLDLVQDFGCTDGICNIGLDEQDDGSVIITLAEGLWPFTSYENQTVTLIETEEDTDYLIGGTWAYTSDDTGNTLEIGAFADSSEELTNLPISGTATYSGNAYGIRNLTSTISEFKADVNLEADFGTSKIDGRLTGADLPSDLILGEANIENSGSEVGFFNDGATSMAGGYTGKWGGNFYGDGATSAAGTFGVSKGTAGREDADSFIGHFSAHEAQLRAPAPAPIE